MGLCQGPIVSVNASDARYRCHGHRNETGWFGGKWESFQVKHGAQPHKRRLFVQMNFFKIKKVFWKCNQ